jgi:Uma2 family endonuclease
MGTAVQSLEIISHTLPELKRFTPQEYLEWERKQRLKHEFIDGKLYTMGGASKKHNKITFNINGLLWFIQQTITNFEAFTTDMRTYAPLKKSYFYPDIVVVKGQDEYLDNEFDTLTNPTVVIEVASKSTKSYDKSKKFDFYRSIPSLEEYFLVSQNEYYITHFYKNAQNDWVVGEILQNPTDVLKIKSLSIELKLSDIYRGIDFKAKR